MALGLFVFRALSAFPGEGTFVFFFFLGPSIPPASAKNLEAPPFGFFFFFFLGGFRFFFFVFL